MRTRSARRVLLLNKPFDVLSQFTTPANAKAGQRTLADLVHEEGVYGIGRLDRDSEGMLLLTDDGALAAELTDPRRGHPRTYVVQVEGTVTDDALRRLCDGSLSLDGSACRPAQATRAAPPAWLWERDPPVRHRLTVPTAWIGLTLTEGRNRQVRRMTAAVGLPTLRLVRVAVGGLSLVGGDGRLRTPPGTTRALSDDDVTLLRER